MSKSNVGKPRRGALHRAAKTGFNLKAATLAIRGNPELSAVLFQSLAMFEEAASSHGGEFESADVPMGYDTVVGYFSRENPYAFDLVTDPFTDLKPDVIVLTDKLQELGTTPKTVAACERYQEQGQMTDLAFPLALLYARLG